MRKVLFLTFLSLCAAQAQSWTVDGPFRDELLGCVRVSGGQVQCSMKSSYIGTGPTYFGATYFASDSAAYAPDNKRYIASRSNIAGRDVTSGSVNVSKAAPVTVTYTFDYPSTFNTIALLFLDTGMLKNVPIKETAAAPAQPSPTQPSPTQTAPAQPSPAPASAPATTPPAPSAQNALDLKIGAFDIKLTDCTLTNRGGYSCKGAELIPKR